MESAVFHLKSEELDTRFIESVKAFFKNRHIKVTITTEEPQSVSDAELLEAVERGQKADFVYTIPSNEFDRITDRFLNDPNFDIISAIKGFKTTKKRLG
jgi:hypothetical protein